MMPRPTHLSLEQDLPRVLALRNGAPCYAALIEGFRSLVKGRRVIVFGSAPDMTPPVCQREDITICVNGSFDNAARVGIEVPDVAFLLGLMTTRTSRQAIATYEVLRGRAARRVHFVTGVVTLQESLRNMENAGFRYEEVSEISVHERAAVIGQVCGKELAFGRLEAYPSTGMLAVGCALLGEAREVMLAGFSLEPGHSYVDGPTRRHHKSADQEFLRLCRQRGLPLSSTSAALADACALPLSR